MKKASCTISVYICKLDEIKYETLLVLCVITYLTHYNKDTR